MPSRSKIYRDFVKQMKEQVKQENQGTKRVCTGDKPYTGIKKKEKGNER